MISPKMTLARKGSMLQCMEEILDERACPQREWRGQLQSRPAAWGPTQSAASGCAAKRARRGKAVALSLGEGVGAAGGAKPQKRETPVRRFANRSRCDSMADAYTGFRRPKKRQKEEISRQEIRKPITVRLDGGCTYLRSFFCDQTHDILISLDCTASRSQALYPTERREHTGYEPVST